MSAPFAGVSKGMNCQQRRGLTIAASDVGCPLPPPKVYGPPYRRTGLFSGLPDRPPGGAGCRGRFLVAPIEALVPRAGTPSHRFIFFTHPTTRVVRPSCADGLATHGRTDFFFPLLHGASVADAKVLALVIGGVLRQLARCLPRLEGRSPLGWLHMHVAYLSSHSRMFVAGRHEFANERAGTRTGFHVSRTTIAATPAFGGGYAYRRQLEKHCAQISARSGFPTAECNSCGAPFSCEMKDSRLLCDSPEAVCRYTSQ